MIFHRKENLKESERNTVLPNKYSTKMLRWVSPSELLHSTRNLNRLENIHSLNVFYIFWGILKEYWYINYHILICSNSLSKFQGKKSLTKFSRCWLIFVYTSTSPKTRGITISTAQGVEFERGVRGGISLRKTRVFHHTFNRIR